MQRDASKISTLTKQLVEIYVITLPTLGKKKTIASSHPPPKPMPNSCLSLHGYNNNDAFQKQTLNISSKLIER
jgi:hypothetical protein